MPPQRNPAAAYLGYDSAYPTTPNAQNWGDGRRQWKTDNIALQYTTPNTSLSVFDYRQTRHDDVRRVIKPMGRLRLLDWETYWDSKLRSYGLHRPREQVSRRLCPWPLPRGVADLPRRPRT